MQFEQQDLCMYNIDLQGLTTLVSWSYLLLYHFNEVHGAIRTQTRSKSQLVLIFSMYIDKFVIFCWAGRAIHLHVLVQDLQHLIVDAYSSTVQCSLHGQDDQYGQLPACITNLSGPLQACKVSTSR